MLKRLVHFVLVLTMLSQVGCINESIRSIRPAETPNFHEIIRATERARGLGSIEVSVKFKRELILNRRSIQDASADGVVNSPWKAKKISGLYDGKSPYSLFYYGHESFAQDQECIRIVHYYGVALNDPRKNIEGKMCWYSTFDIPVKDIEEIKILKGSRSRYGK